MQTKTRIFVKRNQPAPGQDRVAHSVDVNTVDVPATLRKLEKEYGFKDYSYGTSQLDPLPI